MLNKKALAASVSAPPSLFVEDVFSTYLYTGTGAALTITNDIDLDGEGGMVWIKRRSGADSHYIFDTERGVGDKISSDLTSAEANNSDTLTAFNNNGFTLGEDFTTGAVNTSTRTYCSWTFRKQAKFFDVVTYTGTGSARTVAHNLGSVPGMIIVKRTDTTGAWQVYHRANTANPETDYLVLNTDAATADSDTRWNDTLPTSTVFSLGTDATVNASGGNYVAYLFAHDAGGFGTAGTDNVISCGSFTTDGSGNFSVNLGYEPQFIIARRSSATDSWWMWDNMRGFSQTSLAYLYPNTSDAEIVSTSAGIPKPNATGFSGVSDASSTFIYMAIRRPMKVPTTGTSVFSPIVSSASQGTKLTTGFVVDSQWAGVRAGDSDNITVVDRLRKTSTNATSSNGNFLETSQTAAENSASGSSRALFWDNTGFQMPGAYSGGSMVFWNFSRRPKFFDTVCYTGTGSATTFNHNLTVVPELMIVKRRDATAQWGVYTAPTGATNRLLLNATSSASADSAYWNDTTPTSSVFTVESSGITNASGGTYVAYLFATLAGVSKVGSYTGNGGTQAIACGFTGGARFVLIKRTDDVGDWYVYDTARGMTLLTDPYLELNTSDAEVATLGSVTTTTGGFTVDASILAAINTNAASYIFLAIA